MLWFDFNIIWAVLGRWRDPQQVLITLIPVDLTVECVLKGVSLLFWIFCCINPSNKCFQVLLYFVLFPAALWLRNVSDQVHQWQFSSPVCCSAFPFAQVLYLQQKLFQKIPLLDRALAHAVLVSCLVGISLPSLINSSLVHKTVMKLSQDNLWDLFLSTLAFQATALVQSCVCCSFPLCVIGSFTLF